ncbi:sodium/calcium exchanger regulatory protein 1-like [Mytilus trossulus]|uniref:sodium/calcium exchanger regulatory protein 1-like n=1 Tax=Mytilus trossulus TaxID=6551 RepID=UPI003005A9C5
MAALNGKWKLSSGEKLQEYLDALGLQDEVKAKALKVLTPDNDITQEIKVSGNDVTIITTTPMGTTETKAAVGEESSQSAIDGSPLKVIYKLDGDKLIEEQKGSFESVNVRALEGGQLIMKLAAGNGVTCTRKYDKI